MLNLNIRLGANLFDCSPREMTDEASDDLIEFQGSRVVQSCGIMKPCLHKLKNGVSFPFRCVGGSIRVHVFATFTLDPFISG